MRRGIAMAAGALLALGAATAAAGSFHTGRLLLAAGLPGPAARVFDDPAWKGVAQLEAGDIEAAAATLRRTRSPEAAYNLGNALAMSGRLADAVKAYDLALARDPDDLDARANKAAVEEAIERAKVAATPKEGSGLANSGARIDHRSGRDDTSGDESGAQSSLGDGMVGDRESGSDSEAVGSGKVSRKGTARQDSTDSGEGSSKGSATDAAGRAGAGGGATEMAESETTRPPQAAAAAEAETLQATMQWLAAIPDDPARFLKLRIQAERDRRVAAGTAVQPGGDGW